MKPVAAVFVLSLALSGSACSQPAGQTADPVQVAADSGDPPAGSTPASGISGTLNLNVGGTPAPTSGRLLGAGGLSGAGEERSGVIGSGVFGGGDFTEAPDIEIAADLITGETQAASNAPPASEEDGLIRLP